MITGIRTAAIVALPVAYRDTRADDLGLFLDLPRQEALLARHIDVDGWHIELRLLGASHQVLATRDGALICSETVACRGDDHASDASLPSQHHQHAELADHAFASRIERLEPAAFRRRVDDLLATLPAGASALCGRFPGDERATTGLRVEATRAEELRWSGWHSYPGTGEVVTTSSRLALHRAVDPLGAGRRR